jgi:hypothetical protein
MTPRDFGLYDVLDLAARAVDESESGRPALAEAAWLEAWASAEGLFPQGTPLDAAAGAVLAAAKPGSGTEAPARLWRALDAAALVVLLAVDGRTAAEAVIPAAYAAASVLEPGARDALMVILAGVRQMAGTGVTA